MSEARFQICSKCYAANKPSTQLPFIINGNTTNYAERKSIQLFQNK